MGLIYIYICFAVYTLNCFRTPNFLAFILSNHVVGPAQFIINHLEETGKLPENTNSSKDGNINSVDKTREMSTAQSNKAATSIFSQLQATTDTPSDKKKLTSKKWDGFNKSHIHFLKSLDAVTLCEWHKEYPRSALLQRARNINHTDIHGENPIFDASRQGHWGIVDMLIDEGCDINHVAKFKGRQTAPILIARNSKNAVEMLVNLVRLNCNLELTGSSHFFGHWNLPAERVTAFQLALMDGQLLATKVLALGGARLIPPTSDNWLPAFTEKDDQDWVLDLLFNPRALKDLCRIQIRKCLCVKPAKSINVLPLPGTVKVYLTVPELEQFEQHFVKPTLI